MLSLLKVLPTSEILLTVVAEVPPVAGILSNNGGVTAKVGTDKVVQREIRLFGIASDVSYIAHTINIDLSQH